VGYVYILQSLKNGRYYVGSTVDLSRRFFLHCEGQVSSTKSLRPLKIVFSQKFLRLKNARLIEYRLKRFKSRKILEQIIRDGKIRIGEGQ